MKFKDLLEIEYVIDLFANAINTENILELIRLASCYSVAWATIKSEKLIDIDNELLLLAELPKKNIDLVKSIFLYLLANRAYTKGDFSLSVKYFKSAKKIIAKSESAESEIIVHKIIQSFILAGWGRLLITRGRVRQAQALFNKAIESYSENLIAKVQIARLLNRKKCDIELDKIRNNIYESEKALLSKIETTPYSEFEVKWHCSDIKFACRDTVMAEAGYEGCNPRSKNITKDNPYDLFRIGAALGLARIYKKKAQEALESNDFKMLDIATKRQLRFYGWAESHIVEHSAYHLNGLGNFYFYLGDYQKAEQFFKKAIALNPEYVKAKCRLADVMYAVGSYHLAEELYNKVLELNPNSAEALSGLGFIYLLRGNTEYAKQHFEKAITDFPRYSKAALGLASIYIENGDYILALGKLNLVDDNDYLLAHVLSTKRKIYWQLGQHSKAIEAQKKAEEILSKRINNLQKLSKYESLKRSFDNEHYKNEDLLVRTGMGYLMMQSFRFESAFYHYARSILAYIARYKDVPVSVNETIGLVQTLACLGYTDAALEILELIISKRNEVEKEKQYNCRLYILAASLYISIGKYHEAKEYIDKASSLQPLYPPISNLIGILNFELGRYKRAAKDFFKASKLKYFNVNNCANNSEQANNESSYLSNLAIAEHMAGHPIEADVHINEAKKLSASNETILRNKIRMIETRDGPKAGLNLLNKEIDKCAEAETFVLAGVLCQQVALLIKDLRKDNNNEDSSNEVTRRSQLIHDSQQYLKKATSIANDSQFMITPRAAKSLNFYIDYLNNNADTFKDQTRISRIKEVLSFEHLDKCPQLTENKVMLAFANLAIDNISGALLICRNALENTYDKEEKYVHRLLPSSSIYFLLRFIEALAYRQQGEFDVAEYHLELIKKDLNKVLGFKRTYWLSFYRLKVQKDLSSKVADRITEKAQKLQAITFNQIGVIKAEMMNKVPLAVFGRCAGLYFNKSSQLDPDLAAAEHNRTAFLKIRRRKQNVALLVMAVVSVLILLIMYPVREGLFNTVSTAKLADGWRQSPFLTSIIIIYGLIIVGIIQRLLMTSVAWFISRKVKSRHKMRLLASKYEFNTLVAWVMIACLMPIFISWGYLASQTLIFKELPFAPKITKLAKNEFIKDSIKSMPGMTYLEPLIDRSTLKSIGTSYQLFLINNTKLAVAVFTAYLTAICYLLWLSKSPGLRLVLKRFKALGVEVDVDYKQFELNDIHFFPESLSALQEVQVLETYRTGNFTKDF